MLFRRLLLIFLFSFLCLFFSFFRFLSFSLIRGSPFPFLFLVPFLSPVFLYFSLTIYNSLSRSFSFLLLFIHFLFSKIPAYQTLPVFCLTLPYSMHHLDKNCNNYTFFHVRWKYKYYILSIINISIIFSPHKHFLFFRSLNFSSFDP